MVFFQTGAVGRFILYIVKAAPPFMQVVLRLLKQRTVVNTSRIFTDEMTDETMEYFKSYKFAPQFTTFILQSTSRVTYRSLEPLTPVFPNVKLLTLDNFWNLDSKATEIIKQFKEIKEISFGPSHVDSLAFNNLSGCEKLEKLVIKKCISLEELSEMKALQKLSIKKCFKLVSNIHKSLNKQNFPSLKNLDLRYMEISDDQLEEICNNFQDQLEEFCVSRCKQLTEKGIKFVSKLNKLRRFEGRELPNVQDREIEWPKTLEEIDLRKCRNVGDKMLSSLKNNKMEKIDIESSVVSDLGIEKVLENSWEKIKCLRIFSACSTLKQI